MDKRKLIEKNGEKYYLKKCESCGTEIRVISPLRKFCYECRMDKKRKVVDVDRRNTRTKKSMNLWLYGNQVVVKDDGNINNSEE